MMPIYSHREKKEEEKCKNYNQLKYEIARTRRMKKVEVIPAVIRALRRVTNGLDCG